MSLLILIFLISLPKTLNGLANVIEAASNYLLALDVLLNNPIVTRLLVLAFNL